MKPAERFDIALQVAYYLLSHPDAQIIDVMAEFNLGDLEAKRAIVDARYFIREWEWEREERNDQ